MSVTSNTRLGTEIPLILSLTVRAHLTEANALNMFSHVLKCAYMGAYTFTHSLIVNNAHTLPFCIRIKAITDKKNKHQKKKA